MVDNGQNELNPATGNFVDFAKPVFPVAEAEPKKNFTEALRSTIDDYHHMFIEHLPPAMDKKGQKLDSLYDLPPADIDESYHPYEPEQLEMAEAGFAQWVENDFEPLKELSQQQKEDPTITPEQQRLVELQGDLRHDLASDVLGAFVGGITSHPQLYEMFGYYGNPYMVQWPVHIMDRIYKQTTDTPEHKQINGHEAHQVIAAVFRTTSVMEKVKDDDGKVKDKFTYDIDYQTPFELHGDFDYLLGVLANPVNNIKQIGKEKGLKDIKTMIRVLPDPDNEDHVIIQIRDNIGGMPAELLEISEKSKTHKALERGETRRQGGTGAGLAIVNEIVRDHFQGSISLKNEAYPDTDQTGLVMNISLPGKLTQPQAE